MDLTPVEEHEDIDCNPPLPVFQLVTAGQGD